MASTWGNSILLAASEEEVLLTDDGGVRKQIVGAAPARCADSTRKGEAPLQRPPGGEGAAVPPGAPPPPPRRCGVGAPARGPGASAQERQRSDELAGAPGAHGFPKRGERRAGPAAGQTEGEIEGEIAPRPRSPSRREIASASTELFPGHLADRELAERAWQLQTLLHEAHID